MLRSMDLWQADLCRVAMYDPQSTNLRNGCARTADSLVQSEVQWRESLAESIGMQAARIHADSTKDHLHHLHLRQS